MLVVVVVSVAVVPGDSADVGAGVGAGQLSVGSGGRGSRLRSPCQVSMMRLRPIRKMSVVLSALVGFFD